MNKQRSTSGDQLCLWIVDKIGKMTKAVVHKASIILRTGKLCHLKDTMIWKLQEHNQILGTHLRTPND
jgi:hypothetical protein